jgi:hypothetical protein
MSDSSQGPGWWQASDGRWYPPQSHPTQQVASAPPTYGAPPPAAYGAPAATKTGMPGWVKALLIIGGILVVLVGGCTVAVGVFATKVTKDLSKDCSFLSTPEAKKIYGADVKTLELSGITKLANAALDTRVLPNAPSCMITPQGKDANIGLSRIAKLAAGDGKAAFAKELTNANGVETDQGNGLTVSSESYLSEEKVTLGDEAFCTTSAITGSSGVLVRKGNTLVYVSVGASESQSGNIANTGLGAIETSNCAAAQKIAKAVLNI